MPSDSNFTWEWEHEDILMLFSNGKRTAETPFSGGHGPEELRCNSVAGKRK